MPLLDNFIPTEGHGYGGGITNFQNYNPITNWSMRRPYWPEKGRNVGYPCVNVATGGYTVEKGQRVPIRRQTRVVDLLNRGIVDPVLLTANATSLRKEDWIQLDRQVTLSARQRLKLWADLAGSVGRGGFNAMAKMTYEYEAMSDPGEAIVDMDALSEGRTDSPLFKLRSLPLPITHSDFWFSQRRLDVSANSGTPLNTSMGEAAGRRVAEAVEKTAIGVQTGITYGSQTTGVTAHDSALTSTVYGITNYPNRNTKTNFTAPSLTTPDTTYNEVLAALDTLYADKFYGPWKIYHSIDWTQYMNKQFSVAGGNAPGETLRSMLLKIQGIAGVERLDFLTSTFTLLFVQMTSDVIEAIDGMQVTTVQWPSIGNLRQNFKVMAIQVPLIKSDYSGNCGILHGTTA